MGTTSTDSPADESALPSCDKVPSSCCTAVGLRGGAKYQLQPVRSPRLDYGWRSQLVSASPAPLPGAFSHMSQTVEVPSDLAYPAKPMGKYP
eukprot:605200-Amphidinium_carterae.1